MWLVIALKNNIQSLYSTGIPHPICMGIISSICSRSYISLDVVRVLFVSIYFLFSLNILGFRPGDLRTEGKQLAHCFTVATCQDQEQNPDCQSSPIGPQFKM